MRLKLLGLPVSLLAVLAAEALAQLPYNPTRVFLDPSKPDSSPLVYILSPSSSSASSFQLLALNVTSTLSAASLPYQTLLPTLPFLDGDSDIPFTAVIGDTGEIVVYTGDCTLGTAGADLWTFIPEEGNGTWVEDTLTSTITSTTSNLDGPNYLAAGISFSTAVGGNASQSSLYFFGGMCPTAGASSSDWIPSANYSNLMLEIDPAVQGSTNSSTNFTLSLCASRGAPIAEAGFTITPLEPTFSNSSAESQIQQQNFLLLGGHTQAAFINMSQIAMFSLPEQSWNFIGVDSPSEDPKTDLTRRDSGLTVTPRSGHTAVLSPDGKSIVLYGGWVGDVSTPADPQLVILELGSGYGGSGDWTWSVPSATGSGPSGGGIYGHGAAMLPGGVMMVAGGYSIPSSSSKKSRRASPTANTANYFYNVTSSAWISSYSNPAAAQSSGSSGGSSPLGTSSQKAALGSGLALGVVAIVGAVGVYFYYAKRLHRQKDLREKELRDLLSNARRFPPGPGVGYFGGGAAHLRNGPGTQSPEEPQHWMDGAVGAGPNWRENGGSDAERTGLLLEIPSPTRGLRKGMQSRGSSYQSMTDPRRNRRGQIHPIDEKEEDDSGAGGPGKFNVIASAPVIDPFGDPNPLRSHPVDTSPTSPSYEQELALQNWVSRWATTDAVQGSRRSMSPDKERTSSNLSDRSSFSNLSRQHSPGRSISQPAYCSDPFSDINAVPYPYNYAPQQDRNSPPSSRRAQSLTLYSRPGTAETYETARSFTTTATSFPQLQAEGQALLGRRGAADGQTRARRRTSGWMGSVRKVLGRGTDNRSTSPSSGTSAEKSSSTTPGKEKRSPRRAVSASSALLWRAKQGADGPASWSWDRDKEMRKSMAAEQQAEEDDEDWDVEAAVEQRNVQVMFTVPKEKLRVVNKGDADSIYSEATEKDEKLEKKEPQQGDGAALEKVEEKVDGAED